MKKSILFLTRAAMTAALYVVLTYVANMFGLASGAIQFRISEALCILPVFTAAAVPGLAVGCFLANLLTGAVLWDVVFGTLATLIGAVCAYLLKRYKYLAPLPTVAANVLIVPFVIKYAYSSPDSVPYLMLTVGIGEVVCAGILGVLLLSALKPAAHRIFGE